MREDAVISETQPGIAFIQETQMIKQLNLNNARWVLFSIVLFIYVFKVNKMV